MRKLSVFNQVSLDGYVTDARGDMSWAHRSDPEWQAFTAENALGGGVLVFGRVTYDLMASFWPTPAPLAASGVSIFVVSTYDTDYILLEAERLAVACSALAAAGHERAG